MGSDDAWLSAVAGNSEMGRAVLAHDWAGTPLGPPAEWPEGLRSAVSICLTTNFPALVVWGEQLIKIYNDGYRPILGTAKHPAALGAPAAEVWPEVWDRIGPLFDAVMHSGEPTWHHDERMVLERNGFPEECFFIYSYSPLYDGSSICGVLDLVTETTEKVIAQRRLECVTALNAALVGVEQVTDACVAAVRALAQHAADVPSVDVFLRIGQDIVLMASNRRDEVSPRGRVDLDSVIDGAPVVLGDGSEELPADLVALPIGGTFGGLAGAVVIGLNPQRPYDTEYRRFVQVLAETITSALDGAYRRSVELGQYRHISDTLQAAMLSPASDLPTIAARYLPATSNLAVGGDWYDVIDLDERRRGLVVGDWVGHGLEAATVMAQLRAATRAMLLEGRSPAEVLEGLDTFAARLDGALGATVVCAVYDREAHLLTYARAAHPPPLVVDGSGPRWLEANGGPPLAAVAGIARTETTEAVDGGDGIMVLYSDGLVERRGEHLDLGLDRLAESAVRLGDRAVQEIADGLLRDLQPETHRDDVVLLVKRF